MLLSVLADIPAKITSNFALVVFIVGAMLVVLLVNVPPEKKPKT
jgi:hypothetical protein